MALVRPKLHARVAFGLGVTHASVKQPPPQPLAARCGREQKQPQLGAGVVKAHTKDRAEALARLLGDPASLARRVVRADEPLEYARHQNLETRIKALVSRIKRPVLRGQPGGVTWAKVSQGYLAHDTSLPPPRLHRKTKLASSIAPSRRDAMGINTERDIEANMQIGPTDQGMVRIFIEAGGVEIPMDFTAEEAEEIAEEIRAAAAAVKA